MQINGLRTLTSALNEDRSAAALGATNKMFWSEYHRDVMELAHRHPRHGGPDPHRQRRRRRRTRWSPEPRHPSPPPRLPGERAADELLLLPVGDDLGRDGPDPAQHRRRTGARVSRRSRSWSTRRGRRAETTSRPASRANKVSRPEELREIEQLAAACVEIDGGRLKLEWGALRSDRPGDQVNDLLWIGESGLVGFLGIYGYRLDQVELCGMVHPSARRQGVFSCLFEAAMTEVADRGVPQALLVVDRTYEAGAGFARSVGGDDRALRAPHDASARACRRRSQIRSSPSARRGWRTASSSSTASPRPSPSRRGVREGGRARASRRSCSVSAGRSSSTTRAQPVGTVRVDRDEDAAGIYGFAVIPELPGPRDRPPGAVEARPGPCRRGSCERLTRGVGHQRRRPASVSELRVRRDGHGGLLRGGGRAGGEALTWPPCAIEPWAGPASRSAPTASAP